MRSPLSLVILTFLLGCQAPQKDSVVNAVAVRGKLTQAGAPLQVAGREIGTGMISLTFLPVDAPADSDQTFATTADDQGNFDLPGGIPAGKYRIAVRQWEPYPTVDKLGGRFDEKNTPLLRTITGKDSLTIDLAQPE